MAPSWTPRAGTRVTTAYFGPGVVTKPTKQGALVRLDGHGGYEIEVAAGELAPIDEGRGARGEGRQAEATGRDEPEASSPLAPRPSPLTPRPVPGELAARRAIEALRFGLVPQQHIEDLTLGFAELEAWALGRFPAARGDRPLVSAITGPFGTGKSHTMAVIRHLAQREGYVTARVEVDGQTISLAKPETFLYHLWGTTAARDWQSSTPLLDLYARAVDAGHPPPAIIPALPPGKIDRVRENYAIAQDLRRRGQLDTHGDALDALLSSSAEFTAAEVSRLIGGWLKTPEGHIHVRRMLGNAVADRPYDLVGALAGHAVIAGLAGYRGLVVTIDEFEVEQVPSRANYERVRQLLTVLTAYLRGETEHRAAPLGLFFATVGEDEHGGDAVIGAMLDATGGENYHLEPWPAGQWRELAARLHRLYAAAYALDREFDPALVERIEARFAEEGLDESGLIRAFIKRYVGALDALYGPPAASNI